MSATDTRTTYACPSWCRSHVDAGFHTGDVANESCLSPDINFTDAGGRTFSIGLGIGSQPGDQPMVDVNGREFGAEEAREVAHRILELVDGVTPASPETVAVVQAEAEARGIAWAELAVVAGVVDASHLTVSDLTRMTMTLGRWEQRLAEHLLRTMDA